MTRVFRVTYAEHLQNDEKEDSPARVDSWRNLSLDVAVVDGGVEEAIAKLKEQPPQGKVAPELVRELRILGVVLVTEAV